jgi:hypothetical protein
MQHKIILLIPIVLDNFHHLWANVLVDCTSLLIAEHDQRAQRTILPIKGLQQAQNSPHIKQTYKHTYKLID